MPEGQAAPPCSYSGVWQSAGVPGRPARSERREHPCTGSAGTSLLISALFLSLDGSSPGRDPLQAGCLE
jgi:hypothetical protein